MSRARSAIGDAAAKVKRRLNRYRRTVLRRHFARGRFAMRTIAGERPVGALPVVMALWSRPERAEAFLAELAAQRDAPPLRLLLWNNAPANDAHYRRVAAGLPDGAVSAVELRSSRTNFGGIARFFLLARLRREGYSGPVILLDDDQRLGPEFVAGLLGRYEPRSITGVWAFNQRGGYWRREEVPDRGAATYVGTGGCVVDASIVELLGFWSALPDRFSFIEDQWMSFRARVAGWSLRKAEVPVEFVLQERNQHLGLHELKEEFYRYLYDSRPDLEPPH